MRVSDIKEVEGVMACPVLLMMKDVQIWNRRTALC